jgi:hypothetical protein
VDDLEVQRTTDEIMAELYPNGAGNGHSSALVDCITTFQKWLHLPDPKIVTAVAGGVAANLIEGDPLWLLIVGPPGSGKTETISPLAELPYVHPAATVTPASLLSGTPKKEHAKEAKGGLLREVGEFGVLLCKDFTSVLAQHRDARAEALAALREVYDGRWDRPVGTAGGIVLSWSGKCGLIGGCTPSIDRHHAVMGTLGERFLLYRVEVEDPGQQARKRLTSRRHEVEMRRDLAAALTTVLDYIDTGPAFATPTEAEWIVKLAVFAAAARTPVERDGYDREVAVMPASEGPARIAVQLGALRDGLVAVGASTLDRLTILHKVAWDAMPTMRRKVLEALHNQRWVSRAAVMETTDIPRTPAERELDDLVLIGLAERRKAGGADNAPWQYQLSPEAYQLWPSSCPEMSGGESTPRSEGLSRDPLPRVTDISEQLPAPEFDEAIPDSVLMTMDPELFDEEMP